MTESKMDYFTNMMNKAISVQENMAKIQEQLKTKRITGSAGGDMVKTTVNGACDILSIKIEPMLINPDESEMLEELIISAINDAMTKAKKLSKSELEQITGGIQIPGLNNFMQ